MAAQGRDGGRVRQDDRWGHTTDVSRDARHARHDRARSARPRGDPAPDLPHLARDLLSPHSAMCAMSSFVHGPYNQPVTRVLLVDDHELVRQGVAAMLLNADGIEVVGEARTGREAIEATRRDLPDVVLMDVRMPDMDGLEATKKIKDERPRTAVIMVTMHDNPAYLRDAVRAGAAGYLLKDVSKEELVDAIRQVSTGGAFIESKLLRGMLSEMKPAGPVPSAAKNLTKREREILGLVAEGLSNREIADKLVLSPETVKSHVAAILEKLNVSDRTQAAIYAVRNGLVESSTAS